MTANMIKGKGFRGALRYNLDKVAKGDAEVLDHTFVDVSEKSILKEVQMVKIMRPNLQKFFYHTSLNFPPKEDLSNATMTLIGNDFLRESGFTQHQYIMFRHHDANHPHIHILVNRIGYDGKVLSDSNDFARCEEILRRLEKEYNLSEVISSRQARERAITKNELEMVKRTNDPSVKIWLQTAIKKTLGENSRITIQEFIRGLEEKGINLQFNQASTGYVSGISYGYNGFLVTGSKLGNAFKWTTIRNVINYEQERDRSIIQQTNIRARMVSVNTRAETGKDPEKRMTSSVTHKSLVSRPAQENARRVRSSEGAKGYVTSLLNILLDKNLSSIDSQPDHGFENRAKREKRKKKRRSRGL
jgi:hypothetical protein